jgi:hypothetical protein
MLGNIANIARTAGAGMIFDKIRSAIFGKGDNDIMNGPFHAEAIGAAKQDVQRDWLFIVNIINPPFTDSGVNNDIDELIMRAKNFTVPSKTVTTTEVNFYGHTQVMPIEIEYDRTITVTFEESQDQFILRNFSSWLNMFDIYSTVVMEVDNQEDDGMPGSFKSWYKTNIELYMYRYNGKHEGTRITFFNAFPTSMGGGVFGHDSASKITYDISFSYDYYKVEKNDLVPDALGGFAASKIFNNPIANFLGINEERIRHGVFVLKRWGPIIAIKAGIGAILALVESNRRGNTINETYRKPPKLVDDDSRRIKNISDTYSKPPKVISTDENRWSLIANDPRYTKKLEG